MANVMITRQGYGEPETIPFYQNELPDDAPIGAISVVTDSPIVNPVITIGRNRGTASGEDYVINTNTNIYNAFGETAISTFGFANIAIEKIIKCSTNEECRYFIKTRYRGWVKNTRQLIHMEYDFVPIYTSMLANARVLRGGNYGTVKATGKTYTLTRTSTSSPYASGLFTAEAIDITNYDGLNLTFIMAGAIPTAATQGLMLYVEPEANGIENLRTCAFANIREKGNCVQLNGTPTDVPSLRLDISELTGNHYIGVMQANCLNVTFQRLNLT